MYRKMNLEYYFKDGKIYVWEETFSVLKSKKAYPNAFASIIDKNETTVIIDQSKYDMDDVLEIESDWKIITFDMVLPFGLTGFLSRVSNILADEGISILAVSSYSTDHILVKEKDLLKTINQLENLGFRVEEKEASSD